MLVAVGVNWLVNGSEQLAAEVVVFPYELCLSADSL